MAFTGNWKRTKAENRRDFLELLGVPEERIKFVEQATPVLILKQEGSNIEETYKHGDKLHHVDFIKIGETSKITQWNGTTVEAIPEMSGENKYVVKYHFDGHDYVMTRELLSPDEMHDILVLDDGKVVLKFSYVKA